jgi:hypothetical protein
MKSPFKFLDAFTIKDKDSFFGRDQEIDALYSIVFKTPMLLVYGLSGTGKTSLIQCGLANRFDGPDWYPVFIRRNDNINTSIATVMRNALGNLAKDNLAENVSVLLRKTLRPVYLLFDQFEELFILGKEEEQKQFMTSIRELLDAQLPSKIVLIMREEYIGQLYAYETLIPELFDHRFRVEPMGPNKVKNVISSSFAKFNIHLAEPKEELLDLMVHNISDPRSGITLPYLQVYLDMLYRDKYRKQYGQSEAEGYPKMDITKTDIQSIGRIDNVLERFLEDQTRELRVQLVQKYKTVKPTIIQDVLDVFVSEEGTKRPVTYKQSGNDIILAEDAAATLKDIPLPMLTEILNTLQNDRILRRSDDSFELAHDSLALVIDGRRSQSQKQLQNIRKRLINAHEEYQKTGAFLNQKQLAAFDDFRTQLGLSPEMEKFLDKCEEEVVRQAAEDKDRLQQETRMAQQKKLARTRGVLLTVALALAALAGFMAFQSMSKANELQIMSDNLAIETAKTKYQNDSITNIILQVDQQFGRMDSILSGKLPQSELVKSLITLKSLVRHDTIDKVEMAAQYISIIRLFTTTNIDKGPDQAIEDSVFTSTRVHLSLHLSTPQEKEFIQVKWLTADGNIIGEPTYKEIEAGTDKTKWTSLSTTVRTPGKYRVEVYNSQGIDIGRTTFRIVQGAADEVSMTEDSDFRTMASGTLDAPGKMKTNFKVGDKLYFYVRINSPKSEKIFVQLLEVGGKEIWKLPFTTAVNTAKGSRILSWRGANKAGKFTIRLLNSKGDEMASHEITIE